MFEGLSDADRAGPRRATSKRRSTRRGRRSSPRETKGPPCTWSFRGRCRSSCRRPRRTRCRGVSSPDTRTVSTSASWRSSTTSLARRASRPRWRPSSSSSRAKTLAEHLVRSKTAALSILSEMAERLRETNALLSQRAATNVVKEIEENLTWGQRLADRVAELNGSWAFILFLLGSRRAGRSSTPRRSRRTSASKAWGMTGSRPASTLTRTSFTTSSSPSSSRPPAAAHLLAELNRQTMKDRAQAETDFRVNLKNEVGIEGSAQRELSAFRAETTTRMEVLERMGRAERVRAEVPAKMPARAAQQHAEVASGLAVNAAKGVARAAGRTHVAASPWRAHRPSEELLPGGASSPRSKRASVKGATGTARRACGSTSTSRRRRPAARSPSTSRRSAGEGAGLAVYPAYLSRPFAEHRGAPDAVVLTLLVGASVGRTCPDRHGHPQPIFGIPAEVAPEVLKRLAATGRAHVCKPRGETDLTAPPITLDEGGYRTTWSSTSRWISRATSRSAPLLERGAKRASHDCAARPFVPGVGRRGRRGWFSSAIGSRSSTRGGSWSGRCKRAKKGRFRWPSPSCMPSSRRSIHFGRISPRVDLPEERAFDYVAVALSSVRDPPHQGHARGLRRAGARLRRASRAPLRRRARARRPGESADHRARRAARARRREATERARRGRGVDPLPHRQARALRDVAEDPRPRVARRDRREAPPPGEQSLARSGDGDRLARRPRARGLRRRAAGPPGDARGDPAVPGGRSSHRTGRSARSPRSGWSASRDGARWPSRPARRSASPRHRPGSWRRWPRRTRGWRSMRPFRRRAKSSAPLRRRRSAGPTRRRSRGRSASTSGARWGGSGTSGASGSEGAWPTRHGAQPDEVPRSLAMLEGRPAGSSASGRRSPSCRGPLLYNWASEAARFAPAEAAGARA